MTRKEFKKVLALAMSPDFQADFDSLAVFHGCALDTKRRFCTLHQAASCVVYHCATFGGTFLPEEIEEQAQLAARWDLVHLDI